MDNVQSINNIIKVKNVIEEELKKINCSSFEGQEFGQEKEYNCESIYGELDALLTDITTLTKEPKQFLKLSTHDERVYIHSQLNNIKNHLSRPSQIINDLDGLKQAIRPFHIRYTKNRLINFDIALSELTNKNQELTNQLNTISETKEQSDKTSNDLIEKQEKLKNTIAETEEKEKELREHIAKLNQRTNNIANLESQVQRQQGIISDAVNNINTSTTQLDEQKKLTEEYRANLNTIIENQKK